MRAVLPTARGFAATLFGLLALAACSDSTSPRPAMDPNATSISAAKGIQTTHFNAKADLRSFPGASPIICAPSTGGVYGPGYVYTVASDHYLAVGSSSLGLSAMNIQFTSCTTVMTLMPDMDVLAWTAVGDVAMAGATRNTLFGHFMMTQYASGKFTIDPVNFDGGTGRFADASGLAAGHGFIDRETLIGWFDLDGTITR